MMIPRFPVRLIGIAMAWAVLSVGCMSQSPSESATPASSAESTRDAIPVVGIANVTFKVSDLEAARAFYEGVLGLPEAFTTADPSGEIASVYFKINDDQYIEVTPNLEPGELERQGRVVFQSSDIEELHAIYASRGLNPGEIEEGPDGNPVFRIIDPEGNVLDFLQYVPGSLQVQERGNFLGPNRISTHLLHAGIMVKEPMTVTGFYHGALGFVDGRLPGERDEYLELVSSDLNVETKDPPLSPDHPEYEREQYGAVQHVGLEVPEIRVARDTLQMRGGYSDLRVRAHVGNSRRWLVFVFDPDGTRIEMMESALQDRLPPMTVMAPGEPAPPILPETPGVLPWPRRSFD